MPKLYPNKKSKSKKLVQRLIKTDDKLYKAGAALATLYTAMEVINSVKGYNGGSK